MTITHFYQKESDGRIRCLLCPRECRIQEGKRGSCFIREVQNSEIVLSSYGRSTGFCIDPIEKKPLYHFLPGTPVFSFGTAGCNLFCKFCQNYTISTARQVEIMSSAASPESIAQTAEDHNCSSIAFTYNDPVIFMEYAIDTAIEAKKRNIKTVAVTAGYIYQKPAELFFKYIDAANIDLKSFSDSFYRKMCSARLQPVLDTLKYVYHNTSTWLEITTLLIPGENDSEQEIDQLTSFIAQDLGSDVPLHFSAFHAAHRYHKSRRTGADILLRAREIALKNGLHYVYTGNIHSIETSSTFCSFCGSLLIERSGYELTRYKITSTNKCPECENPVHGLFQDKPGNWGNRRLPVSVT